MTIFRSNRPPVTKFKFTASHIDGRLLDVEVTATSEASARIKAARKLHEEHRLIVQPSRLRLND